MDNLFAPVDQQDDNLKVLATKFGDGENIDLNKLAKAKLESDRFIEQLKNEMQELRGELKTKANFDELLTQLKNNAPRPVEVNSDQQPTVTPPAPQPIDPDAMKSVFDQLFAAKEAERARKTNQELVTETLTKKFGADAQLVLNQKAQELGVPLSYLAKIADENPKVFFRTIGVDDRPAGAAPIVAPRGSNTQSTDMTRSVVRDNKYWAEMKVKNPEFYFSTKARMQQHEDALAGHYTP